MHSTTAPKTRKAFIYRLLGIWAVLVAVITLTPTATEPPESWLCFRCVDRYTLDLWLNVALFVPLGLLLAKTRATRLVAILIAFGLTVGIEITQIIVPGRHASLLDIGSNTVGAAFGLVLGNINWSHLAPRRVVAVLFLLVGLLQFPLSTWMLAPASTGRDSLVGLVGHTFPNYVPFGGQMLSAELEGAQIPYGDFADAL